MKIVIPTLMREHDQRAYKQIPEELLSVTYFATREDRVEILREVYPDANIIPIPQHLEGIASHRQYCLDALPKGKVWMIDDKVGFHHKRSEDMRLVGTIDGPEFVELYNKISEMLDEYAQVGVAERIGNNRVKTDTLNTVRVYGCNALRTDVLDSLGIRFDGMYTKNNDIKLYEDFYLTLSLLTKGYDNASIYSFGFSHGGHNTKGGNSTYRNWELQKRCAEALESEFPSFVKTYQKQEKSAWKDMEQRWDVRVQWKKAYLSSKKEENDMFEMFDEN